MGGAAPVETGKGAKKGVNGEINLVPFIDLLSCLISFLLMTAVWTQVSTLQVSQTGGLSSETKEDKNENTTDVRVTMTDRGYVFVAAGTQVEIPKTTIDGRLGYDTNTLVEKLKVIKNQFPEQRAVTVASEDATLYEDLVHTVDVIVANELPDVSVTAAVN